ncbi:AAA family ATPase [Stutzerimonas stutzeri]|uniref:Lon protease family protein n=1 Tax=Stutzerimonas sp. S1 TaxID=3030652 RepID=UPI00222544FE|nr:ATP-binding protein [Stutzerimonas sp. S1]MCW3148141.1 AAA family ATPase [Stutzerimonas sp. S1]
MQSYELPVERLYHACDDGQLSFETTAELPDLAETLGQNRALDALRFGVGIRHEGYNLYVMGSPGLGKHAIVRDLLAQRAAEVRETPDWCYINNFRTPHKPLVLRLPAGTGVALRDDMQRLVRELIGALPAAFDSDDYRNAVQAIKDEFKAREEALFGSVGEQARQADIMLMSTPSGYTLAPLKNGEVLGAVEFEHLSDEEKQRIEQSSETLRQALRQTLQQIAAWHREHDKRIEQLNADTIRATVDSHMSELEERYKALPEAMAFLAEVKQDIIEKGEDTFANVEPTKAFSHRLSPFNRYFVNVLVDNANSTGAPLVYEDHPNYQNLMGRVEHMAHMGTLLTDFTLIKSGALHRANGGYLVLDARKLLMQPFAWEALKRALQARELRLQSLEQMLSLGSTISLEPDPIPLDVKVVLVGDRLLYHLLNQYDPEFALLFKVEADFAEDFERTPENTLLYARLLATLQRREKLKPLQRSAVARLIEYASRHVDDAERLSLHVASMLDMLRESDFWAGEQHSEVIRREDVDRAVSESLHRADQMRERMHEAVLRNLRLIDSSGSQIGQINGLAVIQLGKHAFGHPVRITSTARLGDGKVIDIEREVELGGALHSKGVMILSSYLASRFAGNAPLSLAASLVFEQSYGPVEGDSASAAELCVLQSALANLPLRQDLAITGSVNQHGNIQVIGGVNEKIEGFFDICQARGLSGSQGVIIPQDNAKHLMLRQDVVDAVRQGLFHVYGVSQIDEAMELLCGLPAGVADVQGVYPENSVNGAVQRRLRELGDLRQRFSHPENANHDHPNNS